MVAMWLHQEAVSQLYVHIKLTTNGSVVSNGSGLPHSSGIKVCGETMKVCCVGEMITPYMPGSHSTEGLVED